MLRPKLLDTLKTYTIKQFLNDSMAGIIVAIVALPLAIAFAIASGVTPEKGLYTAVIAGFIISLLGGSRVQVGGPTGAFVVIVYGIIAQYGFNGLLIATILAGIILVIMGIARFGAVIKFIPHSVIVGFTSGIALIILLGQISDFLGLGLHGLPADFFDKLHMIMIHLDRTNLYAVVLAVATILVTRYSAKLTSKVPGSLIAILLGSVAVAVFHIPVETIGGRFGTIPTSLPSPIFPHVDTRVIFQLFKPAFTIAMLAGIESLLSAVVADGMIGGKHRSNMELVAQGVANIITPFFGGIPATGAIARTATNVKNGGRTPVAGIVHALVLFLIILFFGKWVTYIPMACLAGVLIVVAYNMSEWRSFLSIMKSSSSGAMVLLTTFILTIVVDITVAIEIGLLLAMFSFMRKMTMYTNVSQLPLDVPEEDDEQERPDAGALATREVPKDVSVYEIDGPMFFGAAYKFKEALNSIDKPPRVLILRMRHVPMIDTTGVHVIEETCSMFKKKGTLFVLSGVQPQVLKLIKKSGLYARVGKENVFETIDQALNRARAVVEEKKNG